MKNLLLVLSPVPMLCFLLLWISPWELNFPASGGWSDIGFVLTRIVPALLIPILSLGLGSMAIIVFENSQTKDRNWIAAAFALAELPIMSLFGFTLYRLAHL